MYGMNRQAHTTVRQTAPAQRPVCTVDSTGSSCGARTVGCAGKTGGGAGAGIGKGGGTVSALGTDFGGSQAGNSVLSISRNPGGCGTGSDAVRGQRLSASPTS